MNTYEYEVSPGESISRTAENMIYTFKSGKHDVVTATFNGIKLSIHSYFTKTSDIVEYYHRKINESIIKRYNEDGITILKEAREKRNHIQSILDGIFLYFIDADDEYKVAESLCMMSEYQDYIGVEKHSDLIESKLIYMNIVKYDCYNAFTYNPDNNIKNPIIKKFFKSACKQLSDCGYLHPCFAQEYLKIIRESKVR